MGMVVDDLERMVVDALPGETPAENAEYLRELIRILDLIAGDFERAAR